MTSFDSYVDTVAFIKLSSKLRVEQRLHLQPDTGSQEYYSDSAPRTPDIVRTLRLFLIAFAVCWVSKNIRFSDSDFFDLREIWGIILSFLQFFKVADIKWMVSLNCIHTTIALSHKILDYVNIYLLHYLDYLIRLFTG